MLNCLFLFFFVPSSQYAKKPYLMMIKMSGVDGKSRVDEGMGGGYVI